MNKIENENDITMNHIRGNWRYKVFRYKDKVYLLDGSTFWFSFLLFASKWIYLPLNAYEVNESIIKRLREEGSGEVKKLSWNATFIIVFVSGVVARFFDRIIYMLNLGEGANIIYLYLIPILFIGSFMVSRQLKKKKMFKLIDGEFIEKSVRFKLSPEKNISQEILFPVILLAIIIIVGSIFDIRKIFRSNPDVRNYLTYFLGFFIWFMLSTYTAIRPEHLVGATVIIKDKERK